jgi:hypothetical protein
MKPKTLNEEINRIKNIMGFINESIDEPTGETQEFNGKTYPSHHGSPFDRGSADSWYSRGTNPHKNHPEYSEDLTPEEVDAYYAGYYWNERHGGREEYEDDTDRMGDDDIDESNHELNEDEVNYNINQAIQCFLNKKGIKDDAGQPLKIDGSIGRLPNSKSAQAIAKYQEKLGVYPVDGVWGPDTMEKMPPKDLAMYKDCKSEYGDIFDKGLHMLGLDEVSSVGKFEPNQVYEGIRVISDDNLRVMKDRNVPQYELLIQSNNQKYTITIIKVESGYLTATVNGPGVYERRKFPQSLDLNISPEGLCGNMELGCFTQLKKIK